MTLLDTIQHLSAGPLGWASLVGAAGYALRQGSTALAKRSEAKSKRLVAEAEAAKAKAIAEVEVEKAKAEAEALAMVEAARTEHTEAETGAMRETTLATLLAEIQALRERVDGLVEEVDVLRRALRAAKIPTPPRGIAKVDPRGFTAPHATPADSPDPQSSGPHR